MSSAILKDKEGEMVRFLQRLFGGSGATDGYDLSSLQLPRQGQSLEELRVRHARASRERLGVGHMEILIAWSDIASEQLPNVPFVTSIAGDANAVVRLIGLSSAELDELGHAVEGGRAFLIPVLALCPTWPVLGLRLSIYDNPTSPFTAEAVSNLAIADVQDFLTAVLQNGRGELHLYAGEEAAHVASGSFALRMAPLAGVQVPYEVSSKDVRKLWDTLRRASSHLNSIPDGRRDFGAATRAYLDSTSL